jgi:type I restriction enzyme, S subunit
VNSSVARLETLAASKPYALVGGPFGSRLTSADYIDEGIPVIRGSNLNGGRHLDETNFVYVSEQKVREDLFGNLASRGDIIFTQRGTLGQVAIIPDGSQFDTYVISQSQMKLSVDPQRADVRFIYYYFSSRDAIRKIINQNSSSGVPHINLTTLRNFLVPVPALREQQRIADILSACDDLIENNRRRIALLEEAARMLYREWFVRFRFPGHEHLKIFEGLPKGWDIKPLFDLCRSGDGIQTGPFGSQLHQSDYADVGVPVVMPTDLIGFRVESDGIARIPEELADRLGRHRMEIGDTVYGRRGDIGRRAFIGRRQAGWLCGTGCLRIRPDPTKITPRYLFETLGSRQTAGFIANQAKGSTMLNLSAGALRRVPILYPPAQLQRLFVEQIEAMFELIESLSEQNQKLAEARDLLLPRLMNGEIAV